MFKIQNKSNVFWAVYEYYMYCVLESDDFTMSIKELIVCTVLWVPRDALHPPLWNALMRRTTCAHTTQERTVKIICNIIVIQQNTKLQTPGHGEGFSWWEHEYIIQSFQKNSMCHVKGFTCYWENTDLCKCKGRLNKFNLKRQLVLVSLNCFTLYSGLVTEKPVANVKMDGWGFTKSGRN